MMRIQILDLPRCRIDKIDNWQITIYLHQQSIFSTIIIVIIIIRLQIVLMDLRISHSKLYILECRKARTRGYW